MYAYKENLGFSKENVEMEDGEVGQNSTGPPRIRIARQEVRLEEAAARQKPSPIHKRDRGTELLTLGGLIRRYSERLESSDTRNMMCKLAAGRPMSLT